MVPVRNIWMGLVLALTAGCASTPQFVQTPMMDPLDAPMPCEPNPLFVSLGHDDYGKIFEHVLSVLSDMSFEIQESNRYDGRVTCLPRTAPGLGLLIKPGSPSWYERTLATFQSYRHRVSVMIQEDQGGYFLHVLAEKELEDLPKPIRSTVGAAIFRQDNNVDRQFEVVDPSFYQQGWIPKGRDVPLETEIIRRLKNCL